MNKTQAGDRTVAPSLHSACHSFLSGSSIVHVCFLTASTHFSLPTPQLPHLVSHYWNIWYLKSQNLLGSVGTPYPPHLLSLDTKEFALSSTTGILQVIFFSLSPEFAEITLAFFSCVFSLNLSFLIQVHLFFCY